MMNIETRLLNKMVNDPNNAFVCVGDQIARSDQLDDIRNRFQF